MKLSTQKLIILQTGFIKLCNRETVKTQLNSVNNGNNNTPNSDLEKRVTKIENFLRAGNFAKASSSEAKNSVPESNVKLEEKSKTNAKPKYQGKTQDYWPKLVEGFKTEGKMFMHMNLEGTVAREINDMTLEIEFPNGMNSVAKDFLARPDIRQNLRETIHLACGKEMQIKFVDKAQEKQEQGNEFEKFIGNSDLPFHII